MKSNLVFETIILSFSKQSNKPLKRFLYNTHIQTFQHPISSDNTMLHVATPSIITSAKVKVIRCIGSQCNNGPTAFAMWTRCPLHDVNKRSLDRASYPPFTVIRIYFWDTGREKSLVENCAQLMLPDELLGSMNPFYEGWRKIGMIRKVSR